MRPITVVIVDDEPLARRGIAARLGRLAGVEIVSQCEGGRAAIEAIRTLEPDLVFLDVQMPGIGGFEVVKSVGRERMPVTIFVTAFDRHALQAFEAEALDYLLKPIDDDRFDRAIERARVRIEEQRLHQAPTRPNRLVVRERGRAELIDVDRVAWIEARGDYVRLHTDQGKPLLRQTMTELERTLDPTRFIRAHRSTIVNLDRVAALAFRADRDATITLADGTRLKVGRRYRAGVEAALARSGLSSHDDDR